MAGSHLSISNSEPMSSPIRTALCSFGMSGRVFHAPLLKANPDFELVAVWQRSKSDAKDHLPDIHIERSLELMLNEESIELVVVNTPEFTHAEYAEKALLAGKHVVVEKAFTVKVEEADRLIALAEERNLVLSVFQNRRWDSDFLTIRQALEQKKVGHLVQYTARYDRYRTEIRDSWKEEDRPGTGILYNLGSHLIDQALLLFGMPEWVWGDLRAQRTGSKVADHFQLVMSYPELKVVLEAGYLVCGDRPKYELLGESGSLMTWGQDPQEAALAAGKTPGGEGWGKEKSGKALLSLPAEGSFRTSPIEMLAGHYPTYYEQIAAAIKHGKTAYVSGGEGRHVVRILELAKASARHGKSISIL